MDLSSLTKPTTKPPELTIVGTPGVGKTTLAAMFPSPVFIQAEDGTSVFDSWDEDARPTLFPVLDKAEGKDGKLTNSTKDQLIEQLRALYSQPHEFKTLVIDSITSLNLMFEEEVCLKYNVTSVGDAAGGFYKGYDEVRGMHSKVKDACENLKSKKGMAIIYLAHAGVKKLKNRPDADEHTLYSLDMNDKSIPIYTNLVDGVLYLKQDEFVKGREADKKGQVTKYGKVIQSGERILITSGTGNIGYANAKNRCNLDPEIAVPVGENPLLALIPYFNQKV